MTTDPDLDDQRLATRLGAVALAIDGPPALVYELGRAALAWRHADGDLAQLIADSDLGSSIVRSAAVDDRLLSFATRTTTIEVQLSDRHGRRWLLGQVMAPSLPSGGIVRMEVGGGPGPSAPLDPLGRFEMSDWPAERWRLHIEAPGAAAVTTVWVSPGPGFMPPKR